MVCERTAARARLAVVSKEACSTIGNHNTNHDNDNTIMIIIIIINVNTMINYNSNDNNIHVNNININDNNDNDNKAAATDHLSERDKWGQHSWGHRKLMFFLQRDFWGTPVNLLLYSQKRQGAPFSPICQSSLLLQRPH